MHHFRYSSLDSFRALAIAMVVWHHTASSAFQSPFLHLGHYGVQIFFVISGFIIGSILMAEKKTTGTVALKKFFSRRISRIFPLYYLVLFIYIILVSTVEPASPYGTQFFRNLPYYLTLTSNWFVTLSDTRVIFYIAWSLAAEVQFYLIWSIIVKHTQPRISLGLLSVLAYYQLLPFSICLGVALAYLENYFHISRYLPRLSALAHPLLLHTGKVSYGIYLFHMLVYHVILRFANPSHPLLIFPATLFLTTVVATLSHRYFESRFRPSLAKSVL